MLADGDFELKIEREAEGLVVPETVRLTEELEETEAVVDFDLMPVTVVDREMTGDAEVEDEIELVTVELDEIDAEGVADSLTVDVP